MEEQTVSFTMRIPASIVERIDRLAAAERRSRNNLLSIWLEELLKEKERSPRPK